MLAIKEQEKLTQAEAAERFGFGVASITWWEKCLEPQRTRTKPATKINMKALEEDVKTYPDGYQYDEWAARLGISQRAIGHALKRLSISYKKTLSHPKADENVRYVFQDKMTAYQTDNQPIVYMVLLTICPALMVMLLSKNGV